MPAPARATKRASGCAGIPTTATARAPQGRARPSVRATRGGSPRTWAGERPRLSPSTGWRRGPTSTRATRTSTRSARGAGGPTSSTASPTTTTSSRPTNTSIPGTGRPTTTPAGPTDSATGARTLFALGGAFFWECCGETHPMSFNDLVSTGLGGIAVGEQMYRFWAPLLDNQAGGVGRILSRDRRLPHRSRARLQPRALGPLDGRPSESGGAPRLAGSASALLRFGWRQGHRRGRVDQREHEHLFLHGLEPQLRQRLGQLAPEALRLARRRLPVQLRRQAAADGVADQG